MKYKNIIKLQLPEIQLFAVVRTQLKFSILKDHDEPTILLFETLFCMWECFNVGTELPTKVVLGKTLVLMHITFLNNVRKVGILVLSRTSCSTCDRSPWISVRPFTSSLRKSWGKLHYPFIISARSFLCVSSQRDNWIIIHYRKL
jgi:hypothetical protein